MLAVLLILLIVVVNLTVLCVGLRLVLRLPQVANSPTGRLFFASQHPAIKALRNAVFCETCTSTNAAALQATLPGGGDDVTNARREKNYEAGSGEASTAINIGASVGGAQRSADAVTQRISAALGGQPDQAHSQRDSLIGSTTRNASSHSGNSAQSSTDDANLLSTMQFAPDLMASMRSISDFSYDDDSMLASDPVFAGTGPAKHQPADSLASLLAAASQSGAGAVSEKRSGGR